MSCQLDFHSALNSLPVQEAFNLVREIIVYNKLYIGDIQTTSCHICCYKDLELVISELLQNLLTLCLRDVTMQRLQ